MLQTGNCNWLSGLKITSARYELTNLDTISAIFTDTWLYSVKHWCAICGFKSFLFERLQLRHTNIYEAW